MYFAVVKEIFFGCLHFRSFFFSGRRGIAPFINNGLLPKAERTREDKRGEPPRVVVERGENTGGGENQVYIVRVPPFFYHRRYISKVSSSISSSSVRLHPSIPSTLPPASQKLRRQKKRGGRRRRGLGRTNPKDQVSRKSRRRRTERQKEREYMAHSLPHGGIIPLRRQQDYDILGWRRRPKRLFRPKMRKKRLSCCRYSLHIFFTAA